MISPSIYRDGAPRTLSSEEEEQKRVIYEQMSPRRRKFIDRIGYETWDPFQKPNEPMELRQDVSKRTTHQLVREFLRTAPGFDHTGDYGRGALECAHGIVNQDEKYRGMFDFCVWYYKLLLKEGHLDER